MVALRKMQFRHFWLSERVKPCPVPSPGHLWGCAAQTSWHFPPGCWARAEQHPALEGEAHRLLRACSLPSSAQHSASLCHQAGFPLGGISVPSPLGETAAFGNPFVTQVCMCSALPRYFLLSFLALYVIPNAAFQRFQVCKSRSSLGYFCQHD